jgi:MoaE-MoaD fusion protein
MNGVLKLNVTVLVFAELKKRLKSDKIILSTELPISVAHLLDIFGTLRPEIRDLISSCSVALNGQMVDKKFLVYPNDEIALLPPVSGG